MDYIIRTFKLEGADKISSHLGKRKKGGGGGGVLPMGKGQEFVLDRKNIHCLQRYTYKNDSRIPIKTMQTKRQWNEIFKVLQKEMVNRQLSTQKK